MSALHPVPEPLPAWAPFPKLSDRLDPGPYSRSPWVATEKIHGANLALSAGPELSSVRAFKRRAALPPEEFSRFFHLGSVFPALALGVCSLAAELAASTPGFVRVVVFGELAGGLYPHPGVAPVANLVPVQSGVFYSPELIWAVFDVLVISQPGPPAPASSPASASPSASTASARWLADSSFRSRLAAHGLCPVPRLARASWSEISMLSPERSSVWALSAGYPVLENNFAEGLVLRPDLDLELAWPPDPSAAVSALRIKRKSVRFAEDVRAGGVLFDALAAPVARSSEQVADWLITETLARLTLARIAAARSKLGLVGPSELAAEVLSDVLDELGRDLGGLEPAAARRVRAALGPPLAARLAAR